MGNRNKKFEAKRYLYEFFERMLIDNGGMSLSMVQLIDSLEKSTKTKSYYKPCGYPMLELYGIHNKILSIELYEERNVSLDNAYMSLLGVEGATNIDTLPKEVQELIPTVYVPRVKKAGIPESV